MQHDIMAGKYFFESSDFEESILSVVSFSGSLSDPILTSCLEIERSACMLCSNIIFKQTNNNKKNPYHSHHYNCTYIHP